jgi:uncharacterized protein (UPF0333 family)
MKHWMTLTLIALLFAGMTNNLYAATKKAKKKGRATYTYTTKKNKKAHGLSSKYAKHTPKKYKKSGNGPDLRALTTEQPNAEFTATPDNGVNAVETKTGL